MDGRSAFGKAIENSARWVETFHRRVCVAGLLALCLMTYLPGLVRLPAVDRTEVIFAETTRGMVERGSWMDPRYGDTVQAFRPIGTFWAQGAAARLAGPEHARDIRVYRIPGAIAVTLAVLALYWLSAPLLGANGALLAAGLFAVAPLTVLLSQLAIADGLALLPATTAMLAMLRIYTAQGEDHVWRLALLFWVAMGAGMLVNALHTPILVFATLIALFVMDRDVRWLARLHWMKGVPLALLIAAPWILVRVQQDGGVPFSGLDFSKVLAALGGAQDMKLRAFPGTFVAAALLGFLPGTALLAPALLALWHARRDGGADGDRTGPIARFLLAWTFGYIVYLEAVSSKPGTYMVQTMFPAFALAVALLVMSRQEGAPLPRWHAVPWPPLAALFALFLLAAPYAVFDARPGPVVVIALAAVSALFFLSARAGRGGHLRLWAMTGIAALSLFAVTLLAGILPGIGKIWPARQIARALEGCPPGPIAIMGFREPSAGFTLAPDANLMEPENVRAALVEGRPAYIAGEVRDDRLRALSRGQYRRPKPVACVEAMNVMRGCPVFFTIVATGPVEACANREVFPCSGDFNARALAAREKKGCD